MRIRVYSFSKTLEPVYIATLNEHEVRNRLRSLLDRWGVVMLEAGDSREEPPAPAPNLRYHFLCALKELFPLIYWLILTIKKRSRKGGGGEA